MSVARNNSSKKALEVFRVIISDKVGHLFRTKPGHIFRSKVGQAFWSKVGHYFKVQRGDKTTIFFRFSFFSMILLLVQNGVPNLTICP